MSVIKDGGPAFSGINQWMHHFDEDGNLLSTWPSGADPGMSLRDYFAGRAIGHAERTLLEAEAQGVLKEALGSKDWGQAVATLAYGLADAMLEVRDNVD